MKTITLFAFALTAFGGVAEAQRARTPRFAAALATPAEDPADSLYRIGRLAVNDNDYRKAAGLFQQLVDKYPKSAKAGDALFWRAWALHKLGVDRGNRTDLAEALTAVERQQREYAASVSEDSRVLRSQIRSAQASLGNADAAGDIATESKALSQASGCTGSKADEEMRLAALEGLMSMSSEDAIPILKEVLKQRAACRIELRKKAVWLISTKRGDDVALTLLDVARNDPSSDVRGEAIQWLSQTRSEIAVPMLDSVLFSTTDDEMRKKSIFALSQLAHRNDRARQSLRRAADDAKLSNEIRGEAIFWLGQGRLVDLEYFRALFRKLTDHELREKIVSAVSQLQEPEAAKWLQDMARDKTVDSDTRKNAIFHLSQRRSIDLDVLSTIYDEAKGDADIQDHVLFVYSTRREPAAVDKLMAVAKSDASIERRKQALFWLGQKKDPRVQAFIRDLITKP